MDLLLDAFSLDVTLGQNEKEKEEDLDESDDWDEMCHFLTQKRVSCNKSSSSVSSEAHHKVKLFSRKKLNLTGNFEMSLKNSPYFLS